MAWLSQNITAMRRDSHKYSCVHFSLNTTIFLRVFLRKMGTLVFSNGVIVAGSMNYVNKYQYKGAFRYWWKMGLFQYRP